MLSDYRCFFCFARAYELLLDKENLTTAEKNSFTKEMTEVYQQQSGNFSSPVFSRALQQILKKYTGNADPYKDVKKISNDIALSLYPGLKQDVENSKDPFDKALRLAIAGNIIDFAAGHSYDLQGTIDKVLNSEFAIDNSAELKTALEKAKTVLYLGDNAGEIVFDRLFIETFNHPNLYFAVRGEPAINDATMHDAEYTEMTRKIKVISNGYGAPSTLVEHCSEEFKQIFDKADIIISKGQGNLEGLFDRKDKTVFFMLMVKCHVIADALKVKKGDFVIKMKPSEN